MTTLLSHDTLADMVLEVDRALSGLATLGTAIPDIDALGYQFGCLAGILSDKLGEVYVALNERGARYGRRRSQPIRRARRMHTPDASHDHHAHRGNLYD